MRTIITRSALILLSAIFTGCFTEATKQQPEVAAVNDTLPAQTLIAGNNSYKEEDCERLLTLLVKSGEPRYRVDGLAVVAKIENIEKGVVTIGMKVLAKKEGEMDMPLGWLRLNLISQTLKDYTNDDENPVAVNYDRRYWDSLMLACSGLATVVVRDRPAILETCQKTLTDLVKSTGDRFNQPGQNIAVQVYKLEGSVVTVKVDVPSGKVAGGDTATEWLRIDLYGKTIVDTLADVPVELDYDVKLFNAFLGCDAVSLMVVD